MSYILEALRKSERERQLKQAPSLTAVVTAEPVPRARPWLPWLLTGLLVVVNGAALSYFLLTGRNAAEAPVAGRTPYAPPPARADSAAQGLRRAAPPSAVQPAVETTAVEAPAHTGPIPAVTLPAPTGLAPVEHQTAEERLPPPRLAPLPRAADKAQRLRPAAKPAAAPVPSAQGEESEPADDKPAYRINVLAFGADPKERFAVINMSRYVKGDQLPDGAVVEEIEAHGVVLVRNGKKLRIAH